MNNIPTQPAQPTQANLQTLVLRDTILMLKDQFTKQQSQKEELLRRLRKTQEERNKLLEACLRLTIDCPARQLAYQLCPETQELPEQNQAANKQGPKRLLKVGRQSLMAPQSETHVKNGRHSLVPYSQNEEQPQSDVYKVFTPKRSAVTSSAIFSPGVRTGETESMLQMLKKCKAVKGNEQIVLKQFENAKTLTKATSQRRLTYFEKVKSPAK